jgi:DNA replication protein
MTLFTGFPPGNNQYARMPEAFFTVLLPEIEDIAELKVTLHLFWLMGQKKGDPRCVSDRELVADKLLLHSLKRKGDPRPPEERLRQGLEQAVARGTILRIHLRLLGDDSDEEEIIGWYFFNTARSRKVVKELQGGEVVPVSLLNIEREQEAAQNENILPIGTHSTSRKYDTPKQVQVQIERPNIFVLYEQNIGLLSPLLADELKDAAEQYPVEWIEAAFREAVQHNKRNWSYIRAILRRWGTEGRQSWNG